MEKDSLINGKNYNYKAIIIGGKKIKNVKDISSFVKKYTKKFTITDEMIEKTRVVIDGKEVSGIKSINYIEKLKPQKINKKAIKEFYKYCGFTKIKVQNNGLVDATYGKLVFKGLTIENINNQI